MKRGNAVGIFFYLLPATIMIVVFFVYPLGFLIYTSLTNWTGGSFDMIRFVGMKNYIRLFSNPEFWQTMFNTFIWYAAGVLIHIPLCLTSAIILSQHPPGWKIFRTIYFLPQVIAQLTLAWMWYFIYHPNIGILNGFLRIIGLEKLAIHWLGNPSTALGALVFTWLFNVGFFMIVFLAQIGTIPVELYEAAMIDGASKIQQAFRITIPMLKNTIAISMLLVLTFTFRTFEMPFIMTGGGPGTATQILPLMMYKKFLGHANAQANAIGFTMVILGAAAVVLVRTLNRNREV